MEVLVYGLGDHFNETVPQLALDPHVAQVIVSYGDVPGALVLAYVATMTNPCKAQDVFDIADLVGMDTEMYSPAEWVSKSISTRLYLRSQGFDGFYDQSVLENAEPFQVVVFSKEQLTLA